MNIYVASSWRNKQQNWVVQFLRSEGHEVYDFKNPSPGNHGFQWSEIDPNWKQWKVHEYIAGLEHQIAIDGFERDFSAMKKADACLLLLPCGRSAHIEAGYFVGANKLLVILTQDGEEPELMYKMAAKVTASIEHAAKLFSEYGLKLPLKTNAEIGPADKTVPQRPPFGVMPKKIWLEVRASDLARAINDYLNAGIFDERTNKLVAELKDTFAHMNSLKSEVNYD